MHSKKEGNVLTLSGKSSGKIKLPGIFFTEYDPELIKRAVLAIESAGFQPQGVKPKAGMNTSAETRMNRDLPQMQRTINVGHARLPRKKNRRGLLAGVVARVPQAVGGRAAHPPKKEKKLEEKINKKEKRKALHSAIASSLNETLVRDRHSFGEKVVLPLIVEDKFEKITKTKNVVKTLKDLNVYRDVETAKQKRRIRAGKGKMRGRKYKKKKSLLIVTSENCDVYKAARNLEGTDVCAVKNLNTKLFAPGTKAGRLTLWTSGAVKKLGEIK